MNKETLKKFLPGYYRKSASVNILMGLYATLFDGVREKLKTQDQDLFIVTAMNTVLHEKDVGLIPIESDIMTRRSRVITKLMGNGVFSKAELIELVYAYDNTVVTVEKIGDYIYLIRFTEHGGTPENIEEIKAAIEELKPAHIQINYEFRKNTWDEAKKYIHTWGKASAYTWDAIVNKDIRRIAE